jgi:vancomycin resistance protein YoaR
MLKTCVVNKKIITGAVAGSILSAIILWVLLVLNSNTFYDGISLEGCNVSGMKVEQAKNLIRQKLNEQYTDRLTLYYQDQSWSMELADLSCDFLSDEAVVKAYSLGREGNLLQRIRNILSLRLQRFEMAVEVIFDNHKAKLFLYNIKKDIDRKEKDAAVLYKNGVIQFQKEVTGKSLNLEKSMAALENCIQNRNFDNIDLIVDEIQPRIVYNKIREIDSVVSVFTTHFNTGDINRTHNIRLACQRINDIVLMPGDTFSMNKSLGPRTLENGYKDAPVIFKNELISGPGGGVCQVTTTLYNAVLKSRLNVVERSHHSMPLGYVKPGQDATIAEDYIDLKFKNNSDYPVCITANVSGSSLNVRLIGKKPAVEYIIKLRPEIIEEFPPPKEEIVIDNTVPDNEWITVREAKKGLRVILYREVYTKKGKLIHRDKVSDDVYKPVRAQIKVNENFYSVE